MSVFEKYQGKRVDVNYETGYHFVIEYLSENELKWTALAKRAEGAPEVEKELYDSYEKKFGMDDETYTAAVNSGAYSKGSFINDKASSIFFSVL